MRKGMGSRALPGVVRAWVRAYDRRVSVGSRLPWGTTENASCQRVEPVRQIMGGQRWQFNHSCTKKCEGELC